MQRSVRDRRRVDSTSEKTMNGFRALLTAMTFTASLVWAGEATAQRREPRLRTDIASLRPDLICRIKTWYVPPTYPVHNVPISNDESLRWPRTMPVTVLVEVSNQGGMNGGPFHSVVRITNNGGQIAGPSAAAIPIGILAPRQVWRSAYYQVALSAGTVTQRSEIRKPATNGIAASVALDIGNTVTEGNEANNQCITQFTIVVD